jgi:uncharacterized linocin/CFP29 family protein
MNNFWNETIWKGINDEVRKVAGTVRVAQKVFPTVILDNPSNIPDDTFDLANETIFEGLTKPLVEISALFRLTPNQVANEASLQTALKLAKLQASDLARIEDLIIFQGTGAFNPPNPPLPRFVNVRNQGSAGTGLLGVATTQIPGTFPPNPPIAVPPLAPPQPGVQYGQNTLAAVVQGIGVLNGQSQPGPFALILDFRIVADAYSVLGGTLTTTADLITPLVTGGFLGTAALPPWTGLLVSLGGEPISIYVGVEATAAFTTKSDIEDYRFRVFERAQFDARDPRALVRLNFGPMILNVDPPRGGAGGNTPTTITGFAFTGANRVDFGPAQPAFQLVNDNTITLNSPAGNAGDTVHVRVTTPSGTSPQHAGDEFTYT